MISFTSASYEILRNDSEKRSIIPDVGYACRKPNLSHLSPAHQERMKKIVNRHSNLFSRHKHHLGFKGFQAIAKMDLSSKINCKQAPRNRILPKPCNPVTLLIIYKAVYLMFHRAVVISIVQISR